MQALSTKGSAVCQRFSFYLLLMFVDQCYKPSFIDNFNLVLFINTKAVAKYFWKLKYKLAFCLHFLSTFSK